MLQDWDAMQVEKARKKEERAVAKTAQKAKEKERAAFMEVGPCHGASLAFVARHDRGRFPLVRLEWRFVGASLC